MMTGCRSNPPRKFFNSLNILCYFVT